MEASVDLSSPKKRPRPAYKALWQAEKKRADDLLALLNPERIWTSPVNQRITEPVVMHTEPYRPEPAPRPFPWRTVAIVVVGAALLVLLSL